MASTILLVDAVDYAQRMVKGIPLQPVQTKFINAVNQAMWMAAPWRWSLGSLPTITLVAGTQDYTINYPADFLHATRAVVVNPTGNLRPLEIVPALETDVGYTGQPNQIAYTGTAGQVGGPVRISPKPAQVQGTQTVIGLYKKIATIYTNATIQTAAGPFPDEWYWVFQEGILWQAYAYADDRRAGDASIRGDGSLTFTGQRGIFEAGLKQMQMREPLLLTNIFNQDQKAVDK